MTEMNHNCFKCKKKSVGMIFIDFPSCTGMPVLACPEHYDTERKKQADKIQNIRLARTWLNMPVWWKQSITNV